MTLLSTAPCNAADLSNTYDSELDDATSVLSDICAALDEADCAAFVVGGFGQDRWPVDIRTDLLTVLMQLPAIAQAIAHSTDFNLEFYEQGIQRFLSFERDDGSWTACCTSGTSWVPDPASIRVSNGQLNTVFETLTHEFLQLGRAICPDLVAHPLLSVWIRSTKLSDRG